MNAHFEHPCCGKVEGSPDCGSYEHHAGVVEVWEQDPTQSDTLAKAQAEAAHRPEPHAHINISALQCPVCNPGDPGAIGVPVDLRSFFGGDPAEKSGDWRRCIFRHDVLASHGYETKAGFVCTAHSSSFDND